ncbi:MAG: alpha/beta hydrolase [Deltaproteobacteria bacterium]|nr:alpha/beta hydrolase [Deltaproteobacteria bacterium]
MAQECAIRYPERVNRLVMACTSSGGAGGASFPMHELGDLTPREKALGTVLLSDTRRDAAWQAAHPQKLQTLVDQVEATIMVGADEPDRNVGARRQIEARAGHDTHDRLSTLRMPVFICGGRYDGIAPVSNIEAMHKQIPQSRLEVFEGGHLFLLQDPKAFEQIRAFLSSEPDH